MPSSDPAALVYGRELKSDMFPGIPCFWLCGGLFHPSNEHEENLDCSYLSDKESKAGVWLSSRVLPDIDMVLCSIPTITGKGRLQKIVALPAHVSDSQFCRILEQPTYLSHPHKDYCTPRRTVGHPRVEKNSGASSTTRTVFLFPKEGTLLFPSSPNMGQLKSQNPLLSKSGKKQARHKALEERYLSTLQPCLASYTAVDPGRAHF